MKVTFSGHFLSCPGRIRTHANGTRIRCATVTPQDNSLIAVQSYCFWLDAQNFFVIFLNIFVAAPSRSASLNLRFPTTNTLRKNTLKF